MIHLWVLLNLIKDGQTLRNLNSWLNDNKIHLREGLSGAGASLVLHFRKLTCLTSIFNAIVPDYPQPFCRLLCLKLLFSLPSVTEPKFS